jgi:hypothetical protein
VRRGRSDGDRFEQRLHLLALAQVAGGDRGLRPQLLKLCLQLSRSLRLLSGATDQQQPAGAVLGDEPAGEERADAAGAAADQHGPLGIDPLPGRLVAGRRPRQPRYQRLSTPQGELGLVVDAQGVGERPQGVLRPVQVDQAEAPRVLGGGGANQAGERRRGKVGDVAGTGGESAFAEDDQPSLAQGLGP